MANELTVPLLPCRSIDEIVEFYAMLGFTQTYYQKQPYPCVGLKREDLNLQFFGMPDFKAEDSYGSCVVIVQDTEELFRAFAAGMRATHGKLLVSGIPRMTRPRKRKNADNFAGFSVIDPGGNWIRIFASKAEPEDRAAAPSRLAKMLQNAVVMGDSKGSDERAAKILDDALQRERTTASSTDLLEALAYRAELAVRTGDNAAAANAISEARAIPMTDAECEAVAESLASLDDLSANVVPAAGA
jgi:hypothetical protein